MSPLLSNLLKSILLPPGIILVIALAGLYLHYRRRSAGMYLVCLAVFALYVFSTPFFSTKFAAILEPEQALEPGSPAVERAEAVVVLGCGRYYDAPEYGGKDDISECSLIRLRYAAEVLKYRDLPVLLSGGGYGHENISEAQIMNRIMTEHFGKEAIWLENSSRNTFENAGRSSRMLLEYNIDTVLLVTHAIHMKRAALAFERNRINVIPAPAYFYSDRRRGSNYMDFFPSVVSLAITFECFREVLGIIWLLTAGGE